MSLEAWTNNILTIAMLAVIGLWCLAALFHFFVCFMEWKTGDKYWLARKLWPDQVWDFENDE